MEKNQYQYQLRMSWTIKKLSLILKRLILRPHSSEHVWCCLGESLMGETMRVVKVNFELEIRDRSYLKAFPDKLNFQECYSRIKRIDFPIEYSSTRVKFLIEWLIEKTELVVTEKSESQYQERRISYIGLGCSGQPRVWSFTQKGWLTNGNLHHECKTFWNIFPGRTKNVITEKTSLNVE